MTGFLVKEPAFPFDISALDPLPSFVASSPQVHDHNKEDTSFTEFLNQSFLSFSPSPSMAFIGRSPSSSTSAFYHEHQIDYPGNVVMHSAGMKNHCDDMSRSMSDMETLDGHHVQIPLLGMDSVRVEECKGYIGNGADLQASMAANYFVGLEGDIACEGNSVNDVQASMLSMNWTLPVKDNHLWRFLPSNNEEYSIDNLSCDEFRMYEFKVRRCMRGRSHDWTECPFAHLGEKARRRDPRRFHYSGTACPDFRRGTCRRGDSCELSHGIFECWLHPARYRTQLCKDGKSCKRRVCFFAHSPFQLRIVSPDPVSRSGFSVKSPMASSMDSNPGFSAGAHRHSLSIIGRGAPMRMAIPDGYGGGDGFFDNMSPSTMYYPQFDRLADGFSHNHLHSDGISEGCRPTNSYGHCLSTDAISDGFKLNSIHNHSHNDVVPASNGLHVNEFGCQARESHSYSSYTQSLPIDGLSSDGSCDGLSSINRQARVHLRNQLSIASLANKLDQIMSPTSTLVGHAFSPPRLSPSLSPSESPPMSPGSVFPRKIAQSSSFDAVSQSHTSSIHAHHVKDHGTLAATGQVQSSLPTMSLVQSIGSSMFASARGPSPLSTNSAGDQAHGLDKLRTMSTMTSLNTKDVIKDQSLESAAHSTHAMAQLLSSLKHMDLRRMTIDTKNRGRQSYLPRSMPNSPESRWETSQGESWDPPPERVESGQGIRAKIYGNLGKGGACCDIENPDLGWVNELIK